jgi:hypothetical protein
MLGSLSLGGIARAERPTAFDGPTLSVETIQEADRAARSQVLAALEDGATLPAQAPTLPDSASDRAREVHQTLAFGQKGQAERAAHAHAAQAAAKQAHEDAANRAARGAAASATRSANANSHAAAGQARAAEARAQHGTPDGNGHGNGHAP